jgi:hypothetical protein
MILKRFGFKEFSMGKRFRSEKRCSLGKSFRLKKFFII